MSHTRSTLPDGGQDVAEAWHAYLEEVANVPADDYVEIEERAWDHLQDELRRIADARGDDAPGDNAPFR